MTANYKAGSHAKKICQPEQTSGNKRNPSKINMQSGCKLTVRVLVQTYSILCFSVLDLIEFQPKFY